MLPDTTVEMLVHVARKRGVNFGDVIRDAVMHEFISSLGDDGPKQINLPPLDLSPSKLA
ncbi:hypothetical protein ACP2AV_02130 [Aliiroseovarius sp. PTFE2010]|uniref:hypothetical protein n=1 Tax=Aliiroseovarius sp. PTFE2010 TaxID=3417190 RepID=UPI003CF2D3EC